MLTLGILQSFFVAMTVASFSPFPIITEVHITTFTSTFASINQGRCEDNCEVAYKYFKGIRNEKGEVAWFYRDMPEGAILETICMEKKCAGCGLCEGMEGVKEISEGSD